MTKVSHFQPNLRKLARRGKNCGNLTKNCRNLHQTSPTMCNPTPHSRPIVDSPNVCARSWMDQSNSKFIGVLGLSSTCFPKKNCPFSFVDRHPHVTRCFSGQAHWWPNTASRSVQPVLYGFQMLCCTMHCHWGRKPLNCPVPWNFVTLPEEAQVEAIGNIHKKW